MYDYLDRPLGTLDEGSRFIVWSMRGWTQSMAERRCPPSVLGSAFTRSDLGDALPHFHMAMMALNRDGTEKMGFGSISCPHVSEAEAILLSLLRLIGQGSARAAEATIGLLVRPEATQIFKRALTAVAILLFARYPLPDGVDGQ
ncbi:MAG TPA: hypothetical protein VF475_07895 [Sphingobium sp.]